MKLLTFDEAFEKQTPATITESYTGFCQLTELMFRPGDEVVKVWMAGKYGTFNVHEVCRHKLAELNLKYTLKEGVVIPEVAQIADIVDILTFEEAFNDGQMDLSVHIPTNGGDMDFLEAIVHRNLLEKRPWRYTLGANSPDGIPWVLTRGRLFLQ